MLEETLQPSKAPGISPEEYLELNQLANTDQGQLLERIVELERTYQDNPTAVQLLSILNPRSEVSRIIRQVGRYKLRYFTKDLDESKRQAIRTHLLILTRLAEDLTPDITWEVAEFYIKLG